MSRRFWAAMLGWRLLWLALPLLFVQAACPRFSPSTFDSNFHREADSPPHRSTRWATWDSQHYLQIAEHGYQAGRVSSAFWPLWPAAVRLIAPVAGGSFLFAGLLAANLFSVLGAAGFLRWVRRRDGDQTARGALLFLLAFPSAFFFGLPYSEALFLALAVTFLLALDSDRPAFAAWSALGMTLTRPVGLFVWLPILAWLRLHRSNSGSRLSRGFLFLSPLLGIAAYFLIHWLLTGDPRGAFGVEGVFISGQSLGRLLDPLGFLSSFLSIEALHDIRGSLLDRVLFVVVVATLPALWRRDRIAFWYALPMTLVPAITLRFMAFSRFALLVLPAFWILGAAFASNRRGRRQLAWLAIAASLALQVWLYARHTANLWAG